ncbi:hypothetical protein BD410DRAFT_702164, partial [Rickenella mellea]
PSYSSPDADVVLLSCDGIPFRAHASVLKMASGFFEKMFEMPRDPNEGNDEPLPMAESSDVILALLEFIYPNGGFPKIDSFDLLSRLLTAAEQYEIPRITTYLRVYVMVDPKFRDDSLDLYVIARRYGWEEEGKIASQGTLKLNLTSPKFADVLKKLDSESLLKLQRLHHLRRRAVL